MTLVHVVKEVHREALQVKSHLAVHGDERSRIAPLVTDRRRTMRNELRPATRTDGFEWLLVDANGERQRFEPKRLLTLKRWTRVAARNSVARARAAWGIVLWPRNVDIAPAC